MNALSGKVAVITGSSRGLGLEIARAYAQEGAAVVVSSRTASAVEQAAADLRHSGFQAVGLVCDSANPDQVEALADLAIERFGKLDIWVNNAGVSSPYGPSVSIPTERFVQVLQTNILGTYYGSMTAMRRFLPQHSGKLINLLGRGSDKPVPLQNAYASSKSWVRVFSAALAKEYEDSGVGIYSFNPGLVLTDMLSDVEVMPGYREKMAPLNTINQMWGNPPGVPARKAVWLASDSTDGKTGLQVNILTPGLVVGGAVREAIRRLLRRPKSIPDVNITEVPAADGNEPTH